MSTTAATVVKMAGYGTIPKSMPCPSLVISGGMPVMGMPLV